MNIKKTDYPGKIRSATNYVKDVINTGGDGVVGKGLEIGVGAVLAKTVLRRLPVPLNFVAPLVVEKIILKHGVPGGREILLRGLRWVQKVTEDKPDQEIQQV
jgi:hypothetical protein